MTVSIFRFRSVKGHFCSVLLSNIICLPLFLLFRRLCFHFSLFSSGFTSSDFFLSSHTRDSFSAELIHLLKVFFESFVLFGSCFDSFRGFPFILIHLSRSFGFPYFWNLFEPFERDYFLYLISAFCYLVHQLVFSFSYTLIRSGLPLLFYFSWLRSYEFIALRRS